MPHGLEVSTETHELLARIEALEHLAVDLRDQLRDTERLCVELCSVAMNKAVADYLPFGCKERVEQWLRYNRAQLAVAAADKLL